jgi:hypothetical protein
MTFKEELAKLMKKHNVTITVELEQDYAGVQMIGLEYDTYDKANVLIATGNSIYRKNRITDITGDDILNAL